MLTPGLVDAHTHAAWVGSRHAEYALRMAGGDYRAIAAAGGGIASSARAIAAATEEEIADVLAARLARMAAARRHVRRSEERVRARAGRRAKAAPRDRARRRPARPPRGGADVPRAPRAPRRAADREAYVERVARVLVPEVAQGGLARFVDAYVDANAFTVSEARALGRGGEEGRARRADARGQFADVGGAELCAELGALSADHLEHVGRRGIGALAAGRVSAGLLPTACFTFGQAPPPVAELRAAGVSLVVASDANPGTAPTESLPLAMALAVRLYGLSPAEAILGATRLAADALGRAGARADRGRGAGGPRGVGFAARAWRSCSRGGARGCSG